jgi:hypothetical protein
MQIDQRNAGAAQTVTTAGAYTVDRWSVFPTGASVTTQRVAGPSGYQYAIQITGAASVTALSLLQRIESANVVDLVSQNVTLTATISNSLLTTVTWAAYYPNSTDTYGAATLITSGTFTVTSTATQYVATFNLGANAANGVAIYFSVGAQTSGTFTITGVQLEAGSLATPFERLPIGETLMLCQRYFEIVNIDSIMNEAALTGNFGGVIRQYFYKVTKRASPSHTLYSGLNLTGTAGVLTTPSPGGTSSGFALSPKTDTLTIWNGGALNSVGNYAYGSVTISAEL